MKSLILLYKRFPEASCLALILAIALLVRLGALALYPHVPESDELAYLSMAANLVSGKGIVDVAGNHAMYNMGYPTFILAPLFLVFGESLRAVLIANALLGCLSVYLCYVVAREAGAGRGGRLLAALFWAVYLPAGLYTVYVFKEHLLIPLLLALVACTLRLARAPRMPLALACGILFGLIALTGNAALSLAAVSGLALLLMPGSLARRLGCAAVIAALALAVATPWMLRNDRVLGAPVLNTNGGFNLYLGNNPAADGNFVSIADTPRGASWGALRKTGEVEASATLKREALEWMRTNPEATARLAVTKLWLFWKPPFHAGEGKPSRIEQLVRVGWAAQYLILAVAALAGLWMGLRNRNSAMLWLALAAYSGSHMLFYVMPRYREPVMPLLCVLAALALERMAAYWLQTKKARQGPGQTMSVEPMSRRG